MVFLAIEASKPDGSVFRLVMGWRLFPRWPRFTISP